MTKTYTCACGSVFTASEYLAHIATCEEAISVAEEAADES